MMSVTGIRSYTAHRSQGFQGPWSEVRIRGLLVILVVVTDHCPEVHYWSVADRSGAAGHGLQVSIPGAESTDRPSAFPLTTSNNV